MNNLMKLFLRDSRNHITQLLNSLIQYKKNPKSRLIIENAFRAVHSIKTEASYLQLDNIANLSHEIENELEFFLAKKNVFSKEKYDSLIKKAEMLQKMIKSVEKKTSASASGGRAKEKLELEVKKEKDCDEFSDSEDVDNEKTEDQVFDEFQLHLLSEAMKRGESLYRIACDILPDTVMKYARLYLIVNNLELHCNLIKTIPAIDISEVYNSKDTDNNIIMPNPSMEENTRIICYVTTRKNHDQIYSIVNVDEVKNIQIINIPYEPYLLDNFQQESLENMMFAARTISVKLDRLDFLFSSIHKMRMELNTKYDSISKEAASILERNLKTMKDSVSHLRMATLSDEFSSMPSLINKIAFNKGKEADIFFDDNNIEIDCSVFEYIYDPIIHIFKNAIDHGIETIEERKAKGKNPKGKIECKTYLEKGTLVIRISDDGKGVDFDKIAEKSGCSDAELKQPGKLLSVISSPGFTTKENADEHSGRGFGMNLVKEKLSKIDGALLEIDSKKDKGTVITIKLSDNYVAKKFLYLISNEEVLAVPADLVEEKVESLTDVFKAKNNQIMYRDIPIYTKEGILFSDKIEGFEKFKGVIIHKNNRRALILCEKILFKESIPANRFYLIKSSLPYLFLIKISGLNTEYYYLDGSITDIY
ncbi:MAG: ATP-binding protein [Spirochaetaceae bacterium]|nr:ATP-binding protein [Spirochaetaceae bacterium]